MAYSALFISPKISRSERALKSVYQQQRFKELTWRSLFSLSVTKWSSSDAEFMVQLINEKGSISDRVLFLSVYQSPMSVDRTHCPLFGLSVCKVSRSDIVPLVQFISPKGVKI